MNIALQSSLQIFIIILKIVLTTMYSAGYITGRHLRKKLRGGEETIQEMMPG